MKNGRIKQPKNDKGELQLISNMNKIKENDII